MLITFINTIYIQQTKYRKEQPIQILLLKKERWTQKLMRVWGRRVSI